MSAIASITTIAAAAVTTIAMGMQVEASQMKPVVIPVLHHGPPGPAQVELDQATQPTVARAAPAPEALPATSIKETTSVSCPAAYGLDADSALVRLPVRYLATWSAMAEALGFISGGGDDAPANLRTQLSGALDAAPAPTCAR